MLDMLLGVFIMKYFRPLLWDTYGVLLQHSGNGKRFLSDMGIKPLFFLSLVFRIASRPEGKYLYSELVASGSSQKPYAIRVPIQNVFYKGLFI